MFPALSDPVMGNVDVDDEKKMNNDHCRKIVMLGLIGTIYGVIIATVFK